MTFFKWENNKTTIHVCNPPLRIIDDTFYLFYRPTVFRQVADFANVFKAFIGTNWIGLPFAFKESGFVVSLFSGMCTQLKHTVTCMV